MNATKVSEMRKLCQAHIGRTVKMTLVDGQKLQGTVHEVNGDGCYIQLHPQTTEANVSIFPWLFIPFLSLLALTPLLFW